jgi:hypothetical protein
MNSEDRLEKLVQIVHPTTSWIAVVDAKGISAILCPFRPKSEQDRSLTGSPMPMVARVMMDVVGTLPALKLSRNRAEFSYGLYRREGSGEERAPMASASGPPGDMGPFPRSWCVTWVDSAWQQDPGPVGLDEIEAAMGTYAASLGLPAWIQWKKLCEMAEYAPLLAES